MGNRLYVGNLSWDTTEDALRAAIEETGGTCKDIHIVTDRETGRPRGFAFAEMSNDAEAKAVIEAMDGKDLQGRNLTVNEAKPRPTGGGGGHRGGGGGGGGGRW